MAGLSRSMQQAIMLGVIIACASALAIISYEYFTFIGNEISALSTEDIRSNARIQSNAIAKSFANRFDNLSDNLAVISSAQLVKDGDVERAKQILNAAQQQTAEMTGAYVWLDRDGNVVWATVYVDEEVRKRNAGLNLGNRPYFTAPKETLQPYFGPKIESLDGVPRLHLSYPILKDVTLPDGTVSQEFNGVISTAFSLETLGKILESELSPELKGRIGILDRDGTIVYSPTGAMMGENVFGEKYQSAVFPASIPLEEKGVWNDWMKESLAGPGGSMDFTINGIRTTSAYAPITIAGERFMTVYFALPHTMASETALLVSQQRNFALATVAVIAAIAIGVSVTILSWNKRLDATVRQKTAELASKSEELAASNRSLEESNRQLKAANEQLAESNKKLEVNDRLQKEFINIAAHELRTPIQPILGMVNIIEAGVRGSDRVEITAAELALLSRNARRLERLSSDILQVSRIESNTLKLNVETFDLSKKLLDIVEDHKVSLENTAGGSCNGSVRLVLRLADAPLLVAADPSRIEEVMSNLLDNAKKFTERGEITVTAAAAGDDNRNEVVVTVTDTGTGIDREVMPRLFKFASKSDRGTGLGLFISKSIIEAHGGRIWADNNADGKGGATFTFTLPLARAGS